MIGCLSSPPSPFSTHGGGRSLGSSQDSESRSAGGYASLGGSLLATGGPARAPDSASRGSSPNVDEPSQRRTLPAAAMAALPPAVWRCSVCRSNNLMLYALCVQCRAPNPRPPTGRSGAAGAHRFVFAGRSGAAGAHRFVFASAPAPQPRAPPELPRAPPELLRASPEPQGRSSDASSPVSPMAASQAATTLAHRAATVIHAAAVCAPQERRRPLLPVVLPESCGLVLAEAPPGDATPSSVTPPTAAAGSVLPAAVAASLAAWRFASGEWRPHEEQQSRQPPPRLPSAAERADVVSARAATAVEPDKCPAVSCSAAASTAVAAAAAVEHGGEALLQSAAPDHGEGRPKHTTGGAALLGLSPRRGGARSLSSPPLIATTDDKKRDLGEDSKGGSSSSSSSSSYGGSGGSSSFAKGVATVGGSVDPRLLPPSLLRAGGAVAVPQSESVRFG